MSTEGATALEPMDTSPCGEPPSQTLPNGHSSPTDSLFPNGEIKQEAGANDSHIKTESPDTIASVQTLDSVVDQVAQQQQQLPQLQGPPMRNGDPSVPILPAETQNSTTSERTTASANAAAFPSTNGRYTPQSILPQSSTASTEQSAQQPNSASDGRQSTPVLVNGGTTNNSILQADLKTEPQSKSELSIQAVLEFLKKHNLQETEKILKRESKVSPLADTSGLSRELDGDMAIYRSEGDPDAYEGVYESLKTFVETALDSYRHELSVILYPCFVHMYLELVYNNHSRQAESFMERFGPVQEEYFQDDIRQLSAVRRREQMAESLLMQNFRSGQYTVRMCKDTYNALKRYLSDKRNASVNNIVQENIFVDVYEGIARSRQQVEAVSGSAMGEANKQMNKIKVFFGLPKEPTIIVEEEEEIGDDGDGKPKKKKSKKDSSMSKKTRADPNAPPSNRIPFPELRDADKLDRINASKDATKRVRLGPGSLPSICFYTLINSHLQACAVEINDEASMMAVGLQDSRIKVFSLTPSKLKAMKSAQDLETVDREADDVLFRMMDEKNASEAKILTGHQGPVTSLSFSSDKQFLLSGSEDGTIRLWSLLTWSNVVAYKGHVFPVWSVQFAPAGYYFASCGHDRTARLWATDSYQPLRVFAGHYSDVDCVQFHPNSNYVATGSTDRAVRLWDVLSGQCVRYMTGHKSTIHSLAFSSCGRFLCSAGVGGRILVWDIHSAHLLADLWSHTDTVHQLSFSREGTILASGGMDCCVKVWDFSKLVSEFDLDEMSSNAPMVRVATEGSSDGFLLSSYPTKSTSVLALHFTRRNLLLAAGSPV
ncbi:transcription initiation factor TFIID subunit 5 [Galendromus occidentalis]|uniref:Transcription initiation factor TFIID subunit 5 n=1 Tax=Galendromus occidentalis TaxID=34638 RepID=A0AAJ6QM55_9ACAR|nr:transcription initiation factor TFIID subunit 5 [Galendromus occidentalis]